MIDAPPAGRGQASLEGIKTGAMIALVSVVVWLFAEAQSITELAIETEIRFEADLLRLQHGLLVRDAEYGRAG